jgi:type VI secretion system protein ImpA
VDSENTMNPGRAERESAPRVTVSRVESRAHAYQLLDLVARYLAEHEPHSPTPFLLQRAVTWGQLPLPELMREIVRTEGDMARYLALLGIE